jgi:hypothetical protein
MKRIVKKMISAAAAVIAAAAMAVCAFADYTYSFDDSELIGELKSDSYEINGDEPTEITMEKELGDGESDDGMTIRFALFNEFLDPEFWNNPDVSVSVDVKLETEGADVIGYIPGFDIKWTWINPSDFTSLVYGEWVTITETGSHFYDAFKTNDPNQLLFQVRSNWGSGEQGTVKITIRNMTIHDGTGETVLPVTEESVGTADSDSQSAETVEAAVTNTEQTTVAQTTAATTRQTAAAPATSIDYSQYEVNANPGQSIALVFIVIIAVVVVVVVGVVVGYIIYKKKKYY